MALELGLQPVPNYLAAMESGASLGLNLRKQDIAESQAADRLKLAYAHLSATQEAGRQRAAQIAAGNLLRQAHEQALLEHYTQMEENARRMAEKTAGSASIVEHPEVPGMQFLRNPSGAETPVVRPEKAISPAESLRLQMEAQNMMKPGANELATDPSYQSRTNFAGSVLDQLTKKSTPKSGKRVRVKGPNGEKGTVPEDADLPEGWSLVK